MGSCTQKLKKIHKENLQKKHQEKSITTQHSKNQSMQTQESVQEKKQKIKLETEITPNFNQLILLQTGKLSKYYSLMQTGKSKEPNEIQPKQSIDALQIIQHNLTGRVRIMETLARNEKTTKYIDMLLSHPLSHPNVSQVHEIFQEEYEIHIISDYCSGGSLGSLAVKSGQGLEEYQALKILIQIIEAINHVHNSKLEHGHLTFNSFLRIDESQSNYIKLADIKPIFVKTSLTLEQLAYAAPEITDNEQEYTLARDVWAIGIIFYKLLTGNLPYSGNTAQKLKSDIRKGVLSFSDLQFDKISSRSKELLKCFLQHNPTMRSDLSFVIKMPIYRKLVASTKQISKQTVGMLTSLKPASLIQSLFLQYLVTTFCQNQQQEINQLFNKYDQNGDAKLNRNEICELLYEQLRSREAAQQHVNHIFKVVDTDHNGTIDCHEFIRCIIDRSALITQANLKIIFKMLSNGRGAIHKKRFMELFCVTQQQTDEMFATVTKTKRITFKVFQRTMLELI